MLRLGRTRFVERKEESRFAVYYAGEIIGFIAQFEQGYWRFSPSGDYITMSGTVCEQLMLFLYEKNALRTGEA